jgi:hypothetical protein
MGALLLRTGLHVRVSGVEGAAEILSEVSEPKFRRLGAVTRSRESRFSVLGSWTANCR